MNAPYARRLLQLVADHVRPVLRDRGWRVKRLLESTSQTALGLCVTNGRTDADAASANIMLNLRVQPFANCPTFFSFGRLLNVMVRRA